MILDTAEEMYRYFLTEVRKERTIVITPADWSVFINVVVLDWIKTKLPDIEFNQKRIDDLEAIKVLTDGVSREILTAVAVNQFQIPFSNLNLPKYMHGLSAKFGYSDSAVMPITLTRSVAGKILRSDKRVVYEKNPYRQPDNDLFIYFEQRGGYIYCIPESLEWNRLVLEYYSYPSQIEFNGLGVDEAGSFQPLQNKEIVDMAVTRYLERVSDQRIQTQPSVSASVPK
jgi:hypothetical protein